ncbi:uncharacterized protein LOC129942701 [Eupeodes corollae]|uniref:uncharacterized protein LOC129942701 n=1 Tax=Eupeodes corollae TaxID=290404 RepID=UPI0024929A1D|nr:uncharacterized protein LOC129942701 [Eupeodes corollae]
MLFVRIVGILFLCSLAGTDMITLKPFLKSRYSLRERRAKSTTRAPLNKLNETNLNFSTTEAVTPSISTQAPTQIFETTTSIKAFTGNQQQEDSYYQSTTENPSPSTPSITTASPVAVEAVELTTAPSLDTIFTTSALREVVFLGNEVTEKIFVAEPSTTTKKIETTTQTEWLYDYYASDDENPKREPSA